MRKLRFNFQTAGGKKANAPPPLFFVFRARGRPASLLSFSLFEGMERREAPGSLRGSLHRPCDRPVSSRRASGTQERGGGGPVARGPLRGALRLPALQRDAIVGHRTSLRHPTPLKTDAFDERGGFRNIVCRNKVKTKVHFFRERVIAGVLTTALPFAASTDMPHGTRGRFATPHGPGR